MYRSFLSLTVVAAVVMSASRASAESTWFPMYVGNEWSYIGSGGAQEVLTFTRVTTFGGREVFALAYTQNPANLGLENYWSAGPDGDVLLSGFFRSEDDFGLVYDPPIPLVDVPLALGKTWTHTARITRLPDMLDLGEHTFGFEVYTEGIVSVPAGAYFSYGIGQRVPATVLSASDLDISGRRLSGGSPATDWWTDGLGRAQYEGDALYRLTAFNFPTPTSAVTWGQVKAIYR